jgi:hypothetical protein
MEASMNDAVELYDLEPFSAVDFPMNDDYTQLPQTFGDSFFPDNFMDDIFPPFLTMYDQQPSAEATPFGLTAQVNAIDVDTLYSKLKEQEERYDKLTAKFEEQQAEIQSLKSKDGEKAPLLYDKNVRKRLWKACDRCRLKKSKVGWLASLTCAIG